LTLKNPNILKENRENKILPFTNLKAIQEYTLRNDGKTYYEKPALLETLHKINQNKMTTDVKKNIKNVSKYLNELQGIFEKEKSVERKPQLESDKRNKLNPSEIDI